MYMRLSHTLTLVGKTTSALIKCYYFESQSHSLCLCVHLSRALGRARAHIGQFLSSHHIVIVLTGTFFCLFVGSWWRLDMVNKAISGWNKIRKITQFNEWFWISIFAACIILTFFSHTGLGVYAANRIFLHISYDSP